MTCFAVLDTNVLVSALLSSREDAATVQVVERLVAGRIIPVYSDDILSEYRDVLNRAKFGFDPEVVQYLLRTVETYGLSVTPSPTGTVLPDIKDLPFYEVVMEARDDGTYLVTGNLKHFPREPFIVTARQLLDILGDA
ncbi:MAG: PIN domain-containing protein [Clostridia bacterium]|nr:PIN domain-containing protein [Clostridia bacterium]